MQCQRVIKGGNIPYPTLIFKKGGSEHELDKKTFGSGRVQGFVA